MAGNASFDKKTRDSHRQVDGEIRELDEPFSNGLMYPGDPDGGASEVVNCRCALLQRARWALGNDYTKWSPDAPVVVDDDGTTQYTIIEAKNYEDFQKKYKQASERVRESVQKMNDDAVQRLKNKGISVEIENAGNYKEEVMQNLEHLDKLCQEYNNTTVSYALVKGSLQEGGAAYMLNGRTAISINPASFKKIKATDSLNLGDNQPYGITYHEFAHALSQSREKIDVEFWKEMRKIKREYEEKRGKSDWFDIKISDYASKDVDEFLAEAFTQAKLSDNPSIYSKKVLEVVDKYFKKEPLENIGKSSTIKADKVISGHSSTPKKAAANSVIDHVNDNGTVDARGFYGDDGMKQKDIHTNDHGNPKWHDYGNHGEHGHDYEWNEDGSLKNKTTRELDEKERKENGDIL